MTIKLYGQGGFSTATDRVLTALHEKDVTDFEIVLVDIMKDEQKTPEYLEKQPFAMIPALEDGDLTLFESRAMARYVCKKFSGQGTALYGSNPKEAALTEVWLEVESQNYHPPAYDIVEERLIKPLLYGEQEDEAVVASRAEKLGKILDIYEARLAKHKYLAGDFFSLADLSHLPYTHFLVAAKMGDTLFNGRPHVKAWWDDISSRPAWKKVKAIEFEPNLVYNN